MKLQKKKNVSISIACHADNSRHSINWLALKELFYSIIKTDIPILCPAVFHPATRGKRPSKYEINQLFSVGDHTLDRLSPLLPLLPGLPVSITQNISPKLGLANGSTGTIVGYQFSKDATFKSLSFQGCPLRLSSKLPEIVYVSERQISWCA